MSALRMEGKIPKLIKTIKKLKKKKQPTACILLNDGNNLKLPH